MNISVIGTGYVGLVAGACFADVGHTVYCVDQNEEIIKKLKDGIIPIYEPGLEQIVLRAYKAGKLHFTTSKKEAVENTDVIFLALGTPSQADGSVDMKYVKQASLEVGEVLNAPKIIVNKSTVPVGTHKNVKNWVESTSSHSVRVASNPEFLKEGTAVHDFQHPDRVVIGTDDDEVFKVMEEIYKPFLRQGNPLIRMSAPSAEVSKYACNAFLATRISYMNELANLCEKAGADVEAIRKVMATDQRIGKLFLYAGVGFGGSCFPKDVREMVHFGKNMESPLSIIDSAYSANERQKYKLVEKIKDRFGEDLTGKNFAIWGLSFKPNTDDIREAPALIVIKELLDRGAKVKAYDPIANDGVKKIFKDKVTFCKDRTEALNQADALVLVTEWNEFKNPDFKSIKSIMRTPVVFDGRNIYDPVAVRSLGYDYYGIGRGYETQV